MRVGSGIAVRCCSLGNLSDECFLPDYYYGCYGGMYYGLVRMIMLAKKLAGSIVMNQSEESQILLAS